MSATELPILDPANILHDPSDPLSPPSVSQGYAIDPIAKVRVGFGLASGYDNPQDVAFSDRISLRYIPKLDLEMFQNQRFDEIAAIDPHASVNLAELSLSCKVEADTVVARIERDLFFGIGPNNWDQWWARHAESDLEYQFWPNDLPGRNVAVAAHFLHFLPYIIEGQIKAGLARNGENMERYVVTLDTELAAYIGTRAFPIQEELANGDIAIFRGKLPCSPSINLGKVA